MKKKQTDQKPKLKIGIIGCGKMGRHHMRTAGLQHNVEVTALSDPLADPADLTDVIPNTPKIYQSAEELFQNTVIDVAHIVTPPATHAELAMLALNSGSHVYVEKPFSLQKTEAEAIFSLAREKGLNVCAGHQVLFEKPAIIARRCLNEIGDLVHIESYFSFRTVRRNISPVDQLLDILPHPVSLLLHFLEQVTDFQPTMDALHVSAKGEVRAIIAAGEIVGALNVTLRGRPVESYVRLTGTNGSLLADFVRGTVIKLPGPGASAISVVFNTYSQAVQSFWKPTSFFVSQALKKHKSYPGLSEILEEYYSSIINNVPFPISPSSTISTVALCETISEQLKEHETIAEKEAQIHLAENAKKLSPVNSNSKIVLVTGGTGTLGREVAKEQRNNGYRVRILARSRPLYSKQLAGVEYFTADLGEEIPDAAFADVSTIVHCAAETVGGKKEHERNTIDATHNIILSAAKNGIKKFIHISSIAVLKTSKEVGGALDEETPLDADNLSRGPYVWGKAKAEQLAIAHGEEHAVDVKVIRLGPLVDFSSFQAPGRLGKEAGPFFVAVGPKKSRLSLCDVQTAARVIRSYIDKFDEAPAILNLVEPNAPTREELVKLLRKSRADLKCIWFPLWLLKAASPFLLITQRLLVPKRKPIDLVAVFSTEPYNTALAAQVLHKAS